MVLSGVAGILDCGRRKRRSGGDKTKVDREEKSLVLNNTPRMGAGSPASMRQGHCTYLRTISLFVSLLVARLSVSSTASTFYNLISLLPPLFTAISMDPPEAAEWLLDPKAELSIR